MSTRPGQRRDSRPPLRPRILVADDDADHREVVALALEKRLGAIELDSTDDGYEAYRAACARAPDLAILDIDMPGLDGVQLAIALHSRPGLEHLPIIVVSGRIGVVERELLERAGVRACFSKPVALADLARAVRDALGIASADRTGPFPRSRAARFGEVG